MLGYRKLALTFVIALGMLAFTNSSAQATLILRLSDGTTTVEITDGESDGGGDDDGSAGTAGLITFSGTVGNFIINVTTGIGDPVLPNTPYQANIHLNNVSVSSTTGGTLTIELTQTDLTLSPIPGSITLNSSLGGTTGGTVEAWQVLDLGNAEFAQPGTGDAEVQHGPFGSPSFSDNGSDNTPYAGGTFSLNEKVVITHGGGVVTTSFDIDSLAVVPVPGTLLLCLSGLPMFAGAWWQRQRRLAKQSA